MSCHRIASGGQEAGVGAGSPESCFSPALTLKPSVSSSLACAAASEDTDTLELFPNPFFPLRSVIPTLGFTAPQGVSSCLKGQHGIFKTICFKQKTNMQNTAVLAEFGGREDVPQNPNKQIGCHSPKDEICCLRKERRLHRASVFCSGLHQCLGDCSTNANIQNFF